MRQTLRCIAPVTDAAKYSDSRIGFPAADERFSLRGLAYDPARLGSVVLQASIVNVAHATVVGQSHGSLPQGAVMTEPATHGSTTH
jgi:hypothetical protein